MFIGLSKNPASTFENPLLLIKSFRFLVVREWKYLPLEKLVWLFMAENRQFFLILLFFAKVGLDLLQQDGPRIPNIKAIQFFLKDKDGNKSRPSQFSINLTVQHLLVSGLEC